MTKIGSKQLFALTFFTTIALFIGFGNPLLLKNAGNSTLVACLIGVGLGLLILLLILYIANNTNFTNFFKGLKEKNKVIGNILSFLFIIFALYILAINAWSFVNFVISQLLSRNSYYVFAIVFFLIVAYMVSKNIEVMGRTMFILFLFTMLVFFTAVIFLAPTVEFDNILPLFDVPMIDTIKSALFFPSFATIPLFFILAIGKKDVFDKRNYNKAIISGYLVGCLVVITILFFIISVYGIDVSKLFSYPAYTILKKIRAFDFIERIENILSLFFFSIALGSLSLQILFIYSYIKDTFKITKAKLEKGIIYLIALGIPLLSIYYFKHNYIFDFYALYPYLAVAMLILIILTAFFTLFVKKRAPVKN